MAAEISDSKAKSEAGTETQKGNGVDPKTNNVGGHVNRVEFLKENVNKQAAGRASNDIFELTNSTSQNNEQIDNLDPEQKRTVKNRWGFFELEKKVKEAQEDLDNCKKAKLNESAAQNQLEQAIHNFDKLLRTALTGPAEQGMLGVDYIDLWNSMSKEQQELLDTGTKMVFINSRSDLTRINHSLSKMEKKFIVGGEEYDFSGNIANPDLFVLLGESLGGTDLELDGFKSTGLEIIFEGLSKGNKTTIKLTKGSSSKQSYIIARNVKISCQGEAADPKKGKKQSLTDLANSTLEGLANALDSDLRGARIISGLTNDLYRIMKQYNSNKIANGRLVDFFNDITGGTWNKGAKNAVFKILKGSLINDSTEFIPGEEIRYSVLRDMLKEKYESKGNPTEAQKFLLKYVNEHKNSTITDLVDAIKNSDLQPDQIDNALKKVEALDENIKKDLSDQIKKFVMRYTHRVFRAIPESIDTDDAIKIIKNTKYAECKEINVEDLDIFNIDEKKFLKATDPNNRHIYLIVDKDTGRRLIICNNVNGKFNTATIVDQENPKGNLFAIYPELSKDENKLITSLDIELSKNNKNKLRKLTEAIEKFNHTLKGTDNEGNRLLHFYNGAPIKINVVPRDLAYQISCNLKDSTARLFDTSSKAKKKEDEILSSELADE